jgi:hypothetical protein
MAVGCHDGVLIVKNADGKISILRLMIVDMCGLPQFPQATEQ